MNADSEQARRYRQRAVEVRTIADSMREKTSRRIMLGIADDYDRMAKTLDAVAASDSRIWRSLA